ncbi:hypothetical protein [Pseudoalteromonas sp. ECSMB14103]|nr:hypothetical protein [Pseudoalteromonas sp. ECSMB14103]
MMEYLEISKFVTSIAVAAVTVLIRFIYNLLTRNGEKMKIRSSSVELIDKVINDREWKKRENRLVVEETFEQLYSKPLTFQEIKILIYSETPNAAFRTYLRYRPALEFNEKKTKFRYRNNKRPYWFFPLGNIRIPRVLTKGAITYTLLGFPASIAMNWLVSDMAASLSTKNLVIFWFLDALIWLIAVIFLLEGIKYQSIQKDVLKDLGDKFEFNVRFK